MVYSIIVYVIFINTGIQFKCKSLYTILPVYSISVYFFVYGIQSIRTAAAALRWEVMKLVNKFDLVSCSFNMPVERSRVKYREHGQHKYLISIDMSSNKTLGC